ncbi:MAG: c-type cytochrome [Gemmatimonadota bacterium]
MPRWMMAPAALTALIVACEPSGDQAATDQTPPVMAETEGLPYPFQLSEQQARGMEVFETMCWTCHGLAGRGDGPAVQAGSVPQPPSFYAEPIASLSAAQLEERFQRAMEGEQDPSHPHMRMITELIRPERFQDALAYVPVVTWPQEIPGSAMAGRDRYENLCMSCHGEDGQGHGPAAEVLLVPPAQFPSDTLIAEADWQGLFQRIKEGGRIHGSSMPAWGLMLSDDQVWDLVAYIASFQPERLTDSPIPGG